MLKQSFYIVFCFVCFFYSQNIFCQDDEKTEEVINEPEDDDDFIDQLLDEEQKKKKDKKKDKNKDLEEDEDEQDLADEELGEGEEDVEVYSVFNDFRIPIRENINISDLRYNGWVTDPGMYAFRCKNGKRVRLTLWYLNKGSKEVIDSEFINVTETMDKCNRDDLEFIRHQYSENKQED